MIAVGQGKAVSQGLTARNTAIYHLMRRPLSPDEADEAITDKVIKEPPPPLVKPTVWSSRRRTAELMERLQVAFIW